MLNLGNAAAPDMTPTRSLLMLDTTRQHAIATPSLPLGRGNAGLQGHEGDHFNYSVARPEGFEPPTHGSEGPIRPSGEARSEPKWTAPILLAGTARPITSDLDRSASIQN